MKKNLFINKRYQNENVYLKQFLIKLKVMQIKWRIIYLIIQIL